MPGREIRIRGLEGIPEIEPGDNLCEKILASLRSSSEARLTATERVRDALASTQTSQCGSEAHDHHNLSVETGAIFVVAQKVVSKAEGRLVRLDSVLPSPQARQWALKHNKDPRIVEVVLREAKRVVRMDRGILIVETQHGFICANGGVDTSNAPRGSVVLLPENPDRSAASLWHELQTALNAQVAVIISDTFGRPWRQGLANVALGVAGLSPFVDYRGQVDSYGRTLQATVLAVADELASAAELVMGKTRRIPVALIEGFEYAPALGAGHDLIRPPQEDLFR